MAFPIKTVGAVDAFFDCIPIVSSLTNAAHLYYKDIACRVGTHNPAAPGFKTTVKLYSLNKRKFPCVVGLIPILGNMIKLIELAIKGVRKVLNSLCLNNKETARSENSAATEVNGASALRYLFNLNSTGEDILINALCLSDEKRVHLSLANDPLNDPKRAQEVLTQSAMCSNNEIFKQVLNHRRDWRPTTLISALFSCSGMQGQREKNAQSILDSWRERQLVLTTDGACGTLLHVLQRFLANGKTALAAQVIGILPEKVSFNLMKEILLTYSCPQNDSQSRSGAPTVLTEEQRQRLIKKSESSYFLSELANYYARVVRQATSDPYRRAHFDTLNQLLDHAELLPEQLGTFIEGSLLYEELEFSGHLITKYKECLTPDSKVAILAALFPRSVSPQTDWAKRVQLFTSWIKQWKDDIPLKQSTELYKTISISDPPVIKSTQNLLKPGLIQHWRTQFLTLAAEIFPHCKGIAQEECDDIKDQLSLHTETLRIFFS